MAESRAHQPAITTQVRLRQLGVQSEHLRQAVLHGYTQAAACALTEPAIFRAWTRWATATGRLRELLAPAQWTRRGAGGYETTEQADGQVAIVIYAGDAWTGIKEGNKRPSTRNPKGGMTKAAIRANTGRETLEMGFDLPANDGSTRNTQTYILLHYHDETAKEIRAELSLPTGISEGGYIDIWSERLVLPPIAIDLSQTDASDADPEGDDIFVPVSPRKDGPR